MALKINISCSLFCRGLISSSISFFSQRFGSPRLVAWLPVNWLITLTSVEQSGGVFKTVGSVLFKERDHSSRSRHNILLYLFIGKLLRLVMSFSKSSSSLSYVWYGRNLEKNNLLCKTGCMSDFYLVWH